MLSWHCTQIVHFMSRLMHVRRYVLAHCTMCNLLHDSVVHLFVPREGVCDVLCVRAEKSEMNVCLDRCTVWKAHQ